MNLTPGPLYNCVTNASNTKMAVRSTASTVAKNRMTGKLARMRSSLFHHTIGVYCARRFSTRNEPLVPQRTEIKRCLMRHHSTKVTDQTRRIEEYSEE